jgi:uncharacterized protein
MQLQRRFFDHFLKGVGNGWECEPPVQLNVRRAFSGDFDLCKEHEWLLARVRWIMLYLDAAACSLDWAAPVTPAGVLFEGMGSR